MEGVQFPILIAPDGGAYDPHGPWLMAWLMALHSRRHAAVPVARVNYRRVPALCSRGKPTERPIGRESFMRR